PDGTWLATLANDQTARLWDLTQTDLRRDPDASLRSGRILYSAPVQSGSLLFSPDGRRLVAPGTDGIVRFWTVAARDAAELIELARRTAGRNLSHKEWDQYLPKSMGVYQETFPGMPIPPDVPIVDRGTNIPEAPAPMGGKPNPSL